MLKHGGIRPDKYKCDFYWLRGDMSNLLSRLRTKLGAMTPAPWYGSEYEHNEFNCAGSIAYDDGEITDRTFHSGDAQGIAELRNSAEALLEVVAAHVTASGPRAHRVGCDCSAVDCTRLREALRPFLEP